ncbi:polyprenyl diphosphate synthase [Psychrobacter sp. LV10R520-6]|uniref:polyprenyl diphosphate synthase n=1 Tax=Psychrobacter sp. LV10R520-6 TaxID=1415574 RepID=UPI0024C8DE40|nr:polyprenyl diphosphate synthase [Psychrobacter sp. LV10R520-6]SNT69407.1 Undecaprenyl pyrophosphate synthetase [Psychrobacter sp. LV10R520-6]
MSISPPLAPFLVPRHIAIIMDGNNRYGKANDLGKGEGHVAGKDALDPIVEYCLDAGIEVLTVFAFSSENWQRPPSEVALLMHLLALTINQQMPRMQKYRIRLRFVGDRSQLTADLQELMADAEAKTAHFDAMSLVIAISYSGQWDIAHAAQQLAQQVQEGQLRAEDIDKNMLGQYVQLADEPAVDMLIRTGGEYRLSNFLLWQSAYAELFFTQTLWPNFETAELKAMVADFCQRQRRFGKTSEQIETQTS